MPREPLPSPLLAARSLENGMPAYRQSRESIFVKQGKLLAGYEDDYVYDRPVLRYFPTYQSLTDRSCGDISHGGRSCAGGICRKRP